MSCFANEKIDYGVGENLNKDNKDKKTRPTKNAINPLIGRGDGFDGMGTRWEDFRFGKSLNS